MTPQQKLVRLKELHDLVDYEGMDALLADVHLPPPELMNLPDDPGAWAKHMAATVPGLSEETAYAWMMRAMGAAADWGHAQGRITERHDLQQQSAADRRALVEAVRLVLDLAERRQLRAPMIRDSADPDNPPVSLVDHLAAVLRSVGEEV